MGRHSRPDNIHSQDANSQTIAMVVGLFLGGLGMIHDNGLMLIPLGVAIASSGSLALSVRLNRMKDYEEHFRKEDKIAPRNLP